MAFPLYLSYLTTEQKNSSITSRITSQSPGSKNMDTASVPVVPIDCYEDMFHEIAKKFYGEGALPGQGQENGTASSQPLNGNQGELGLMDLDYQQVSSHTGNGAQTLLVQTTGGPVLQVTMEASPQPISASLSSAKKPKISIKVKPAPNGGKLQESVWEESEESLSWNPSKVASYNPAHKLFRCLECGCVGFLARIAEHWLGAHAGLRVFQCPRCPYTSAWGRCIRMHLNRQHNEQNVDAAIWRENPILDEVTKYLINLKNRVENNEGTSGASNSSAEKRYACSFCSYATDRKDLFTRHETIHSEEKPFQCYVCNKKFNRADHCKKHFSRLHRDHAYDLQKVKKAASGDTLHSPGQTAAKAGTLVVAAAPGTAQLPFYTTVTIPSSTNNTSSTQGNQNIAIRPATTSYPHLGLPAFPTPAAPNQTYKTYTTLRVEALVRPALTIPASAATSTTPAVAASTVTAEKSTPASTEKKKKEKLYPCTYCSWRGVDNWCLKRHLNTHIKPFLCVLCDYKAARSERLATHVLKVHNKRICNKCSFLADDQEALTEHIREHQ